MAICRHVALSILILCLLEFTIPTLFADEPSRRLPQDIMESIAMEAWEKGELTEERILSMLVDYPRSAKLWDFRSAVSMKKREYRKALSATERALEISETPARHLNLAYLHRRLKQHDRAVEHFKTGLQNRKGSSNNYFNMADSLERIGQRDEAIEYYKKYLALAPSGANRDTVREHVKILEKSRQSGCQQDALFTGKRCLCKEELEIMRAVNARDIDRAVELASRVDQRRCEFHSNVLQDVQLLARIKRETPWMLDEQSFKEEMARRDAAFNKAWNESLAASRATDDLMNQLAQSVFSNQMAFMADSIASMNRQPQATQPNTQDLAAQRQGHKIRFKDSEAEEESDRIVLMGQPVPDHLIDEDYEWHPPLNVPKDTIVGVWQNKLFKLSITKTAKRQYTATVLETYAIPTKDRKGLTRYPFAPGEICGRFGEGHGGGGSVFLKYVGKGWTWGGPSGRKWDLQQLILTRQNGELLLRLYFGEAGGHSFSDYMRKVR